MELQLYRNQFKKGTNGALFYLENFVCFMIELPWRNNAQNVSCIPDGRYELKLWYTDRFKHHLVVKDVPGRSGILVHPANHAEKELRGCLAPVLQLTGIGTGTLSRTALDKLLLLKERARMNQEGLFLNITSAQFVEGKNKNS